MLAYFHSLEIHWLLRYLNASIRAFALNLDSKGFSSLLLDARSIFRDSWARIVVAEIKVMRENVFNSFNGNVYFVVPFLTGSEKNFQTEGFICLQLFFHRLETQLFLVLFRNIHSIGDLCFWKIFNDEVFSSADSSEGGRKENFTLVLEVELGLCAHSSKGKLSASSW